MLSFAGSMLPTDTGRAIATMNCCKPLHRVDFPEPGGPMGTKIVDGMAGRVLDGRNLF